MYQVRIIVSLSLFLKNFLVTDFLYNEPIARTKSTSIAQVHPLNYVGIKRLNFYHLSYEMLLVMTKSSAAVFKRDSLDYFQP